MGNWNLGAMGPGAFLQFLSSSFVLIRGSGFLLLHHYPFPFSPFPLLPCYPVTLLPSHEVDHE